MPNSVTDISAAYFPGPESENEGWVRSRFDAIVDDWFRWRRERFPGDPEAVGLSTQRAPAFVAEQERLAVALRELLDALKAEVPSYSPRYIGHMVSELSLPALFGHFATLLHNPNNSTREAAKVGVVIERGAIAMLAAMIGFDPSEARGHFTSGGTVANFEGVWRARYRLDHWMSLSLCLAELGVEPFLLPAAAHLGWRKFEFLRSRYRIGEEQLRKCSAVAGNPPDVYRRISRVLGSDYLGPVVLVPGNKHYSWRKAANVFGLGEDSFWSVELDAQGHLDVASLARLIDEAARQMRPVLMVTSVAGTTETGEIDPVDRVADFLDVLDRQRGWRIWHHVDAAYGGFLCSVLGGPSEYVLASSTRSALAAIRRADSVTIDPHKLGFVPYACGTFLARNESTYAVSSFAAPYLDRGTPGSDKWSSTLEGSRPGSGAAATWLTARSIGFAPDRFGALLADTILSARAIAQALTTAHPDIRLLEPAETNIVCFSVARQGEALSCSNKRTARMFESIQTSERFWVSSTILGPDYAAQITAHVQRYAGVEDEDRLVLIRCVVMNPYWTSEEVRSSLIPQLAALIASAAAGERETA